MVKVILELKGINKSYGSGENKLQVLKELNLKIFEKEFVAIKGTSGSGKSTLLSIIGLLDNDFDGKYLFNEKDVRLLDPQKISKFRGANIGFVFQNYKLLARYNVKENILLPTIYASSTNVDVEKVIEQVGLSSKSTSLPKNLSGGQQQRVAIARALIMKPQILIADEPTGALDSETSKTILSLFKTLNEEAGTTILLVTHDSSVAKQASKSYLIENGGLIEGE